MNTQERKKKRIVIASVLKPADEPRMFGKIGCSLAAEGHEIHCIGFPPTEHRSNASIHLHSFGSFDRISLKRLLIPFLFFRQCFALKPDTIIVCTHELLYAGIAVKLLTGAKLIYDVQENYYLNILYTNAFPWFLQLPLAFHVWSKELTASLFVNDFLLAENVYKTQLHFISKNHLVLENRYCQKSVTERNNSNGYHRLLFTGTIADTTGIWNVIDLAKRLYDTDKRFILTVTGHVPAIETRMRLEQLQQQHSFLTLKISQDPLPHSAIVTEIKEADIGVIWYPPNKSTAGRIPTKYFEYTALGLPILATNDQSIANRVSAQKTGIIITSEEPAETILLKLQSFERLSTHHEPFWEAYETDLQKII